MDSTLVTLLNEEIRLFISPRQTYDSVTLPALSPITRGSFDYSGLELDRDQERVRTKLSIAEASDSLHDCKGLLSWWLAKAFPILSLSIGPDSAHGSKEADRNPDPNPDHNPNPADSNSVPILDPIHDPNFLSQKLPYKEDSPVSVQSFMADLVGFKGVGRRVDEYVTHHVGQSALSKVGGEHMQG
jgi:hypothetical protein